MKDHALRRASLIVMSAVLILMVSATAAFALATVTSVSPNALPPGATNADLILNGSGFLLQPTVTFSPATGITVNSASVVDGNHATVNVTIAPTAPTGPRTVTVDDGLGSSNCVACFTVSPPPHVTGASPSSIGLGSNSKTVTLSGTGFMSGATVAISGVGVAPTGPATFVDSTTITVDLSVQPTAITGARNITVTNPDNQSGTCVGCFTVTPAPRATSSGFSPAQRAPGLTNQVININGTGFTTGTNGTTVAFSGTGITVGAYTRVSSTNLKVTISTANNAPLGPRDVTFTNPSDGGKSTCAGCFSITGPTTVAIAWPSTVNGDIVATFSQPVGGVSSSNSYVRYTGHTYNLATTITCANATGFVVSCSGGNAKKAFLHPSALITPGQHYTVHIAATGASPVTDFGGLTVAEATSADLRGGLIQQGEGAATSATWRTVKTASAFGGSFTIDHVAGATASYRFTGSSVTWYTNVGPSYGIADLYVDSILRATANSYRAANAYRAAFTVSGFSYGKHTLMIRVRGARGSSHGTGSNVAIDAFRSGSTIIASPSLSYTFGVAKTASAFGGAYASSDEFGSTAFFTFRGTAVEWDTVTGPFMGAAKVYIDGVLKLSADNYSATNTYGVAKIFSGLTDTVHTIKIVVQGRHRAASRGSYVAIDRWVVT
jgi:hypothetical protein